MGRPSLNSSKTPTSVVGSARAASTTAKSIIWAGLSRSGRSSWPTSLRHKHFRAGSLLTVGRKGTGQRPVGPAGDGDSLLNFTQREHVGGMVAVLPSQPQPRPEQEQQGVAHRLVGATREAACRSDALGCRPSTDSRIERHGALITYARGAGLSRCRIAPCQGATENVNEKSRS